MNLLGILTLCSASGLLLTASPPSTPVQGKSAATKIVRSTFASVPHRYASVFGVHMVASLNVPLPKFRHAVHVMAQYLDNDENGVVDNPLVVQAMTLGPRPALLFMAANEADAIATLMQVGPRIQNFELQDLYAHETHPGGSSLSGGFDATLEEVLHLVSHAGYARAYPSVFGEAVDTELADAMDLARGGRFLTIPPSYPPNAWYHYRDSTCNYSCMATEYFYWALTSLLGAQDYPGRRQEIANEWELPTPIEVQFQDPTIYSLLTDPTYALPSVLPDGTYQ